MDKPRPCGCKGRRTCLICEKEYNIKVENTVNRESDYYIYCPICNRAYPGWNVKDNEHPNHTGTPIEFPGIYIDLNFLSEQEEKKLIDDIDMIPWDLSQSGRRKQNFGPKCNFKKRKIRPGNFNGFPESTKFIQDKFKTVPMMEGFKTIEQCSLEYNPERGASIDPHIDDCWIWGERIVTVNLLSDSILTMNFLDKPSRYNLDCVKTYPSVLTESGNFNLSGKCYEVKPFETSFNHPIVRIPMPRRSLLIMYGPARYDWEHQVLREDIIQRRICLAYREFTPPYLEHGEYFEEGKEILLAAKQFFQETS
ncbi:alpha-ketoglutarate-dependent dioxygenase alkB homolog 4 [Leptinotarsa decemlineata]|uniref:alpha-ketoglutarate-dependent dioxygenase alkB homolog 4 n=1 Tax=Leptinotarsa decemlineata TaxID=7539 RepID=UPI000C253D2A|nr:alpha-ketoglutarate-dependent dioxygenase alkB homolog 4 [Leptinotarsa decemlineata]